MDKTNAGNDSLEPPPPAELSPDELHERARTFLFVKKFSLSNRKLLMWNKKSILVGDVQKASIRKRLVVSKIKLEIAKNAGNLLKDDKGGD